MDNRLWLVLGTAALALVSGCASDGHERELNDPTNSLVFGYIDMDEAPTKISYASIVQVAPPTKTPYWNLAVNKGLFYTAYLPPGSYQMSKFGGSGFLAGEHVYSFPRQGNQTALRIEKPGIYFLGSYRYRDVKTGMFEQPRFSVDIVNKPTEADLLRRILDEGSGMKDSGWRERIQARLARLKR